MRTKIPNKPKFKSHPLHTESQLEIDALKKENLKLQKEIAKLKAKIITIENQLIIFTEEYTKYKHDHPSFDHPLTEQERKWVDECKQCLKNKSRERNSIPT